MKGILSGYLSCASGSRCVGVLCVRMLTRDCVSLVIYGASLSMLSSFLAQVVVLIDVWSTVNECGDRKWYIDLFFS